MMTDKELENTGIGIRNRVNRERLVLTEVFREEAEKLDTAPEVLKLALYTAPGKSLPEALVIIYKAFNLYPEELVLWIPFLMSGGHWDRFSYASLNIAEDLLGMRRDSLYSIFRDD